MKPLTTLGAGLLVFVAGCGLSTAETERLKSSQERVFATVLCENYTEGRSLLAVPEYDADGFVSQAHSNETVKLGPSTYVIVVQPYDGPLHHHELSISIVDDGDGEKEALEALVVGVEEVGEGNATNISFQKGNLFERAQNDVGAVEIGTDAKQTYFRHHTRFGVKRAGWIRIEK